MNLQKYVIKNGTGKLFEMADYCQQSRCYMQNLLYSVNSGYIPYRTPSLKLAMKMVEFSKLPDENGDIPDGLTMEGLATPTRIERDPSRVRMPHRRRKSQ